MIAFYLGKFPVPSETFIMNQIVGMIDRGHQVDIYARRPVAGRNLHPDITKYGLIKRVRYIPARPRNYLLRLINVGGLALCRGGWRNPFSLVRALNFNKYRREASSLNLLYSALPPLGRPAYDVIHAQFGPLGLRALALRQIGALRGKLITSFRGFDATYRLKEHPDLYAELFREGDLFLPVSHSLRKRLIDHGCDEKKIVVHHSGIDCSRFGFSPRQRIDGQETRLISVSRLEEKKGISYAIQAVSRLVASGKKVAYTVVGEGAQRPKLERMIAELGIGRHVKLIGWRTHDDLTHILREAHLLVAPSVTASNGDEEGIPNSVKEAMAIGLPVVSTLHGGIPELVEDGVSGFLVPEHNVDLLTERLGWLHEHSERWPEIGRAGRTKIEREYDIEKLNNELVELYAGINEPRRGPKLSERQWQ